MFLFSHISSAITEERIAFIDINFIFLNSTAGKNLNLQISDQDNKLNNEIEFFKNKIDDSKKKILSQKNVLSESDYKAKLKKLENDIREINLTISKKNKDLSLFKSKVEKKFFEQLNIIVQDYSINNSISLILKKENLLMAKKNLDITSDIFKIFNEKVKKINIK